MFYSIFLHSVQMKSTIEFDLNRINNLRKYYDQYTIQKYNIILCNIISLSFSLFCVVTKLEDKLEQYKFGLPTLLIKGEKNIYEGTRNEIDMVKRKRGYIRVIPLFLVVFGN